MAKRAPWLITGLCLAAVAGAVYLNCSYFFNPLTFKQNEVTHLPWRWYRNPLQLEYAVLDDDGWKMLTITDHAEISLVFQELQRGARQMAGSESSGRRVWLGIRRQTDGAILLSVNGQEQAETCQLEGETSVILTEKLQQLLEERLQQARTSADKRQVPPQET